MGYSAGAALKKGSAGFSAGIFSSLKLPPRKKQRRIGDKAECGRRAF